MKNFILLLMLSIFVGSCATNDLTIGVTEPAPITIPGNVKRVGVVNRTNTLSTDISKKIDQVLSLELLTNDSLVAMDAVSGLADELRKNTRFTDVKNLNPMLLNNSYIDVFSPSLTKDQVNKICTKNNLDALFILEFFDTNTSADYKANPVKKVVLGTEVTLVETMATVRTLIKLGWKIYDASGDVIYDQFPVSKMVISTGEGINPLKAIAAVVGHKDMVKSNVYSMGQVYANDLLPIYHRVNRIYYVKGSNNFKIGKRLARAGKWNDASDYWNKEINNPKNKVAGRAYFNMGIINEINGNIDNAIDWTEKSYTLFNNKKALHYLKILKNRKFQMQKLAHQQE